MIGKIIGLIVGVRYGGWFAGLIGLWLGHMVDKAIRRMRSGAVRWRGLPVSQHPFFATVFLLAGQLAKADGRISEAEIAGAEKLMTQFGLSGDARAEAIGLFRRGAGPEFQLDAQVAEFAGKITFQPGLKRVLLEYLIAFALADGVLHTEERQILQRIAAGLGFNTAQFSLLLDMLQAQQHFYQRGSADYGGASGAPPRDAVADAYRALGMTPEASDAEIKKAYRKLMSQHHPDKLIAQGVPPEM